MAEQDAGRGKEKVRTADAVGREGGTGLNLTGDKYDKLLDEARGVTANALAALQSMDAKCQFWIAVSTALALKARADKEFVTVPAKYMLEAQKYGILVEHTATGQDAGTIHIRLERAPEDAEQRNEPKVKRYDNFGKEIIDPPEPPKPD